MRLASSASHQFSPSDPENVHSDRHSNICITCRHEEYSPIQVTVPSLFVNREARAVSLAWIRRQQNFEIRWNEQTQRLAVFRPFDPERDIIYIPANRSEEFYNEPYETSWEDPMIEGVFSWGPFGVDRVAVSEHAFTILNAIRRNVNWLDVFEDLVVCFHTLSFRISVPDVFRQTNISMLIFYTLSSTSLEVNRFQAQNHGGAETRLY